MSHPQDPRRRRGPLLATKRFRVTLDVEVTFTDLRKSDMRQRNAADRAFLKRQQRIMQAVLHHPVILRAFMARTAILAAASYCEAMYYRSHERRDDEQFIAQILDALPVDDQALLRAAIASDRLIEHIDVAIYDALDGAVSSVKLEEYAPHDAPMPEVEAGLNSTESP